MKKLLLIFSVIFVAVALAYFWWHTNLTAINPQDKTVHFFSVAPGSSLHQVSDNLQSQGYIKDSFIFLLYMKGAGLSSKIQKGVFAISPSMSTTQIAKILTQKPIEVSLTIIPGMRADEVADLLKKMLPNYQEIWRSQLHLHEGYLFPDTYFLYPDATIDQIILTFTNNFDKKWQEAQAQQTNHLPQEQAVILASILQREAPSGEDMKKVASVLENRLSIGMALQVDASVQYALGYQASGQTWWKKNLTTQDLKINSPYNTYTNPGLPPTPISNPDLEALEAVLNPASTNYFYYISDAKGIMHYATTLEQHNANIRKYGL